MPLAKLYNAALQKTEGTGEKEGLNLGEVESMREVDHCRLCDFYNCNVNSCDQSSHSEV